MNRFYRIAYSIIAPLIRLFFPHRAVGLENLPEGGALICPNHASAWDPVIVAIAMPRRAGMAFMGKEQLFRIPPLGWLFKKLGAFPVKRGGNDLTAMRFSLTSLREGKRLLMFPEGTRSKDGEMGEAKTGAAMFAIRTGVPIVPMYIPAKKKWFRRTPVIFGEPFYPQIEGKKGTPEDYERVADELMERIAALKVEA